MTTRLVRDLGLTNPVDRTGYPSLTGAYAPQLVRALYYAGDLALPDVGKPVLNNFVPAIGSTISASAALRFDVTDDSGSICAFFLVCYQRGMTELVHDGHGFLPEYTALSTRTGIANGYRFSVRRRGGWLASPLFRVYAIDHAGNEATDAS